MFVVYVIVVLEVRKKVVHGAVHEAHYCDAGDGAEHREGMKVGMAFVD
jgi:hypothetical protein